MFDAQSLVSSGDWWQWDNGGGGSVISTPSGLMRRSRFSNQDFVIDNDDVVGLALTLDESYSSDLGLNGTSFTSRTHIGEIAIMAPGQRTSVSIHGSARFLLLGFSIKGLVNIASSQISSELSGLEFTTLVGQKDPILEKALFRLAIAEPDESDEAVLAVAARLVLNHSLKMRSHEGKYKAGLTALSIRRVLDRIEDEINRPLSLKDLASTAGISPYHFAHEFRRSLGSAPHQYLLRRRVDRAVHLLANSELTITEIATSVGFHRGSHMARHMQNILGLAPRTLRKLM